MDDDRPELELLELDDALELVVLELAALELVVLELAALEPVELVAVEPVAVAVAVGVADVVDELELLLVDVVLWVVAPASAMPAIKEAVRAEPATATAAPAVVAVRTSRFAEGCLFMAQLSSRLP